VDTDARGAALLRRIEELAAAAGDEHEGLDTPMVTAALTGLRAELGALRAELGTLRADVTAAGAGLPSGTSRPAGAGDDAGELARRLESALATRLDTLAGDLRRTLSAGLTQSSAGQRAAESAWIETRSALEERLAAVEDTIDGLAERLEAAARDSVESVEARIARVERTVHELAAEALPAAVEAQEQWSEAVREALGELAGAVDRSLGSLGTSIAGAVQETRAEERAHVEDLVAQLDRRLTAAHETGTAATAELRGFLQAFQEATQLRLDDVHTVIAGGLADARAGLVAELQGTLDRLEAANTGSRRLVEDEINALRTDLADALEEVRDRVTRAVTQAQEAIAASVDEQRTSFDATARGLRSDVLDRVEESAATTAAGLADLRHGVTTAARAGDQTTSQLGQFAETLAAVHSVVSQLDADWNRRTDAAIDLAAQAGHAAVDEFRGEVRQVVDDLRSSVDASVSSVDGSADVLQAATQRLVAAGQALLGYLAQRDRLLEAERDRTLHEILDEFAQGLSAKERRGLSDRVGEALERRRDARDAGRFRRGAQELPAVDVPEPPRDLAALAEPLPPRAPRRTSKTAAKPAATKAPAKTAAKTAAKGAAKGAAKRAAKTAAKTAAKGSATPPRTPRKAASAAKKAEPRRARTAKASASEPAPDVATATSQRDRPTTVSSADTTEPLDGSGTTRV
jgi:hypothetical protein